jgi:SIR2-like domain
MKRVKLSKAYIQLIFIFAATLNDIENGPISPEHLALARFLGPQDIILTFNWDTLMERALLQTGHWRVDDGYGLKPHSIFRDGWMDAVIPASPSSPKIIKLHGSVNWLTAYPVYEGQELVLTHGLPTESLFVYECATKPYATFAGRYMDGYAPLTYGYYPPNLTNIPGRPVPKGRAILQVRLRFPWMPEGGAEEVGVASMPLIIPPVREKSYGFFGTLFETLWQQAEQALKDCDEIVIIGYSFPRTDLRSHNLFTQAFMKRNSIPRVTIIDPNPNRPAEKFSMDFGIPMTHLRVIGAPFEGEKTLQGLL